jgi:transposase InsO family protein
MSGSQGQGTSAAFDKLTSYEIKTNLSHQSAQVWFLRLKAAAVTLDCEQALSAGGTSKSTERQAFWLLSSNLPDAYAYLLDTHTKAKDLFDALQAEFAGKTFIHRADLYQQLSQLRPTHERLDDFLNRALELRTSFRSAAIDDEVLLSAFFLISLRDTEQYRDWAIQKLQHDKPDDIPTLVQSLRTTFRQQLSEHVTATPVANQARRQNQDMCSYCGRGTHSILDCFQLQSDMKVHDNSHSNIGSRGSPAFRGGRGGRGRQGRGRGRGRVSTSLADVQTSSFMTSAFNAAVCRSDDFYLDSCCTHHMVHNKDLLSDFKPLRSLCAFADSDHKVAVCGNGTLMLRNHAGEAVKLLNVLYVPTFKSNLISVTQADRHGLTHAGGNGNMTIYDKKGNKLLTSILSNGLYRADCFPVTPTSKSVSSDITVLHSDEPVTACAATMPDAQLVHRRFGHIGYSTLAKMSQSGVVSNLPPASEFTEKLHDRSVCGPCVEGRQKQSPYPRTYTRETVPYKKLHLDIAERRVASRAGSRYFAVLVDDATNFKWVCTVANKNDVADWLKGKIQQFITQGHAVRIMRFDRDSVFLSTNLTSFFDQNGIECQATSGYSPQENGHAERAIGVLKELIQSLLSDSGMSDLFWAEALWHACHLLNISSSTVAVTPWERIKGSKPDAAHLRIWGCKCWVLIPDKKRSSTSPTRYRRSQQCKYLGIAWPNPKAYKLLQSNGKLTQSRHVEFDESAPPFCDSRVDFDRFMQRRNDSDFSAVIPSCTASLPAQPITSTAIPTAPAATVQSPAPATTALSPMSSTGYDSASNDSEQSSPVTALEQSEQSPLQPSLQTNPVFEHEATTSDTVQRDSQIPRYSQRSNKGVSAAKPYDKYLHGFPGAHKVVSFQ